MKRLLLLLAVVLGVVGLQAQGTVAPVARFTAFDNNGLIVPSGKLCTYAAGTTTPLATYSDVDLAVGHQNTNPVVMDSAGRAIVYLSATSYKFTLLTAGTDATCATGTQLWSQDNIAAVPTTSGNVDITCTAGETITAGQVVYWSDGSGSKNAGQCYKADSANTYSSTTAQIGIAPSAIATSAVGTVRIAGLVSNLTVVTGTTYYVGTAGALTSIAPTNQYVLGIAASTSTLILSGSAVRTTVLVNQGGTSLTTLTANNVILGNGTSAPTFVAPSTSGNVLVSNGTTWRSIAFANTLTATTNPTVTASTIGVMMGMAGSITPVATGNVLFCLAGNASNSVDLDGLIFQMRFGTGAAPANGAALTGTAIGSLGRITQVVTANNVWPMGLGCVLKTGLTVNTAAWYDFSLGAVTGGNATATSVVMSAVEVP